MIFLLMIDTPEDKRKFVILYEKYRYLMQKIALDVLQDSFLAEDAVHNAFVSLAYNLDKLDESEDIPTKLYLVACARNAAFDLYRKRRSQMKKETVLEEVIEKDGHATYIESDLENSVLDILKNLPMKYRDVFMLKYVNHMENREIAEVCGILEGTVRQRLSRGKVIIERKIREMEENSDGKNTGNG